MSQSRIYINGLGLVSPQKTSEEGHFLDDPVTVTGRQLRCIDPGYREFIPADLFRRMGRVIKMGVTASKLCLRDAGWMNPDGTYRAPDAIITGTGLGCLEDTEKFLGSMISNREEFLTPTSFIQSTHNTVAGQIALLLKCHGYNFTFVHRGFSFESALIDALTQIRAGMVTDVLAGASDEMTAHSFTILERLGYWKRKDLQTVQLLDDTQRGTIAGEGAAFFLLGNNRNDRTRAEIRDVETVLCSGNPKETRNRFTEMIDRCGLQVTDLDLVIAGFNGDPCYDRTLHDFLDNELNTVPVAYYKHLCGEYNTSSSFALWLASMILSRQEIPQTVRYRHGHHLPVKHILICNHFRNTEHSYILVSQA